MQRYHARSGSFFAQRIRGETIAHEMRSMRSSTRASFQPSPPVRAERREDRHVALGGVVLTGEDTTMNPPGSPAVGSNGSGRVRPPGPIMSPTVDEIATGKNGDSRPDRISAGHRTGAAPVRSDAAMLRSLGWILSRLPSTHMSVVASTRAVGWESVHGVITAGRLEDFFDYSAPFHVVAFNLKGATTVEWKHGLAIHAIPRRSPENCSITPSGEANSIRATSSRTRRSVAVSARNVCSPSPSKSGTCTGRRSRSWQALTAMRSCGDWASGWPRGSVHRSLARASSPRRSSPRSRSSSCGTIRPCRARATTPEEKLADPRLRRVIEYLHGSFARGDLAGRTRPGGRPQSQLFPPRFQADHRANAPPLPDRAADRQGMRAPSQSLTGRSWRSAWPSASRRRAT